MHSYKVCIYVLVFLIMYMIWYHRFHSVSYFFHLAYVFKIQHMGTPQLDEPYCLQVTATEHNPGQTSLHMAPYTDVYK